VPPMQSENRAHTERRHYRPCHLTEANRERWRREGWPYGIKIDLAREIGLHVPASRIVLYREYIGDCAEHMISWDKKLNLLFIERWIFEHPRATDPFMPKWRPIYKFQISAEHAPGWLLAVNKLLLLPANEIEEALQCYVAEIAYGESIATGTRTRVRFMPVDSGEKLYYMVRRFIYVEDVDNYVPTKMHFYWDPNTSKFGWHLKEALETIIAKHQGVVEPAKNAFKIVLL